MYYNLQLTPKEQRNERFELELDYISALYQWATLRNEAIRMGNKNPDGNCLIKDAKKQVDEAHDVLAKYAEEHK